MPYEEWLTKLHLKNFFLPSSQKQRDVRLSLEGLVIPHDTVLPPHLGLHHHGDEPEVGVSTWRVGCMVVEDTMAEKGMEETNVMGWK